MNKDTQKAIDSYLAAIRWMLNGDSPQPEYVQFVAGQTLDSNTRQRLWIAAHLFETDSVYLGFSLSPNGRPSLEAITLYLPRKGRSVVYENCRLVLKERARRAILVASPTDTYRVGTSEIKRTAYDRSTLEEDAIRAGDLLRLLTCIEVKPSSRHGGAARSSATRRSSLAKSSVASLG